MLEPPGKGRRSAGIGAAGFLAVVTSAVFVLPAAVWGVTVDSVIRSLAYQLPFLICVHLAGLRALVTNMVCPTSTLPEEQYQS